MVAGRVYAEPVPADMIDLLPRRDRAMLDHPHGDVNGDRGAIQAHPRIALAAAALAGGRALPDPAAGGGVDAHTVHDLGADAVATIGALLVTRHSRAPRN